MKKKIWIYVLLVIGFTSILSSGCKKDGEGETVNDIDGNIYHTVTIGTQVWMVENLKTTKYNDGMDIPNLTSNSKWRTDVNGAYCNYGNDESNTNTYGRLYNWYAINTGKLAPKGWHVPTYKEWKTMITYLGGEAVAGAKAKATGSSWASPNKGATNESGFTALPGGGRFEDSGYYFEGIGEYGNWWCADEIKELGTIFDYYFYTYYESSEFSYNASTDTRNNGYSVRCVKD